MSAIFLQILDMSITASYVILAVLIIRLMLRKAPKKYSYLLWSVVAFRLCCPVSFTAFFSLLNFRKLWLENISISEHVATAIKQLDNFQGNILSPTLQSGSNTLPGNSDAIANTLSGTTANSSAIGLTPDTSSIVTTTPPDAPAILLENVITGIWITGIAALLLYSLIHYIKLHRELRTAILLRENIYQSDRVCSPFILGFVRPKIYIPFGLDDNSLNLVLEHERYHIKRRDYLVKPFAFALLCVHWFNPLCWLAFYLMGKDMEMSCDEKVLNCNENIGKAYSTTLLSFATNHRFPAPGPLAFGESGAKSRIKNVLTWKRPGILVTILALIICVVTIAICIANPKENFALDSDNITLSPDNEFSFEYNNTFSSMEDYASQKMEHLIGSKTDYNSLSQESPAQATITDAKVYLLEKKMELSNLTPDGTLEAWVFHYLIQLDADSKDIVLVGGQDEPEKGWYSLDDGSYTLIIALRQTDGTYRILECMQNDTIFLFDSYHRNMAEAVYDWGITHYQLDLPLNCQTLTTSGGHTGNYWRIDGDGWYFYQFAPSYDYWTPGADSSLSWTNDLGFTLSITRLKRSAKIEVENLISLDSVVEEENYIYAKHAKNNITDYYYNAPNGGCYRVRTDYPTGMTPALDPEILDVMARSFVITNTSSTEVNTPVITVTPYSDITDKISAFLASISDSALSALTLNKEGTDTVTYRHPRLATNAEHYTLWLDTTWLAAFSEQSSLPNTECSVTLSNGSDERLTAFQGSNQLLFESSEGRWLLHAYEEEYEENELYYILRGWFDEVEYESLVLKYGYDDLTIPDRGQSYLEAGAEGVQILEELHLQTSPGSKYCYSFVTTRIVDAEKDLEVMKSANLFPKDHYGFYLYTIFVPENDFAYDNCWAGNTGIFSPDKSWLKNSIGHDGSDGNDLIVPKDALLYQRCCTVYKADGLWHISIGGTGW